MESVQKVTINSYRHMFVLSYMYLPFWNFRHRLVRHYVIWYISHFLFIPLCFCLAGAAAGGHAARRGICTAPWATHCLRRHQGYRGASPERPGETVRNLFVLEIQRGRKQNKCYNVKQRKARVLTHFGQKTPAKRDKKMIQDTLDCGGVW